MNLKLFHVLLAVPIVKSVIHKLVLNAEKLGTYIIMFVEKVALMDFILQIKNV
jgi:hypothetical protein